MSKPLRCCPHCDADLDFAAGQGDLTRCWLCLNPLRTGSAPDTTATPPRKQTPPPPKPQAAKSLNLLGFLRKAVLTTLVIIGVLTLLAVATGIAFLIVCIQALK